MEVAGRRSDNVGIGSTDVEKRKAPGLRVMLVAACAFLGWCAVAAASPFQIYLDRLGVPLGLPVEGKMIVVNIPAFELIAFEDGEPAFRSRVIVGAPWHRTPRLETHTTAVRFRPTWRPTPSMLASGEYQDRVWPAGPDNPLGLLAVRLEEGMLVYLHDTNHRELFARETRAMSHGCVRVQRWDELAAWLLGTDLEQVHDWANGSRTFDVPTEQVPVVLGYFLNFPDDTGETRHFEDIYALEGRASNEVGSCGMASEAG